MANETIGILGLPQREINRQLYEAIEKLRDNDSAGAIEDIESAIETINDTIGSETESGTILYRLKALEDAS